MLFQVTVPVLNARNLILISFVLVVGVAGWFGWNAYANRAVYTGHHDHGVESHDHAHTHGEGVDHGHEHPSMPDVGTHAHSHRHNRHEHDSVEIPGQERLTEIGHSHDAGQTTRFWARVEVEDGSFKLEFFESVGSEVNPTAPGETMLTALIFNGSELENRAKFKSSNGIYVAPQPDGFHFLPTHIFKIEGLEFDGQKLDAAIPLSQ